jgi:hypothetical protein
VAVAVVSGRKSHNLPDNFAIRILHYRCRLRKRHGLGNGIAGKTEQKAERYEDDGLSFHQLASLFAEIQ